MHEERRSKILELIHNKGFVTTKWLAGCFMVSVSTIQRDLIFLEKQGLLKRTWSGAKMLKIPSQLDISTPHQVSHRELEAISKVAKCASEYVGDLDLIFIDGSLIGLYLLEFIKDRKIVIITNSLKLLNKANKLNLQVILIGGFLDRVAKHTYGILALQSIECFQFAKAFIAADWINENGIFSTGFSDAELKQKILDHALRSFVMYTTRPSLTSGFWKMAGLDNVEIITSDDNLQNAFASECKIITVE